MIVARVLFGLALMALGVALYVADLIPERRTSPRHRAHR